MEVTQQVSATGLLAADALLAVPLEEVLQNLLVGEIDCHQSACCLPSGKPVWLSRYQLS